MDLAVPLELLGGVHVHDHSGLVCEQHVDQALLSCVHDALVNGLVRGPHAPCVPHAHRRPLLLGDVDVQLEFEVFQTQGVVVEPSQIDGIQPLDV